MTSRSRPAPRIASILTILTLSITRIAIGQGNTTDGTFGPYLQNATPTGIVVCWRTGTAGTSEVEYGPTSAYGQTVSQLASANVHQVAIGGLAANSLYHYRATTRVSGQSIWSETGTFRTAVAGDVPFRYAFLAETHDRDEVALFQEEILGHRPDLIVNGSDHVDEGNRLSEWDEYYTIGQPFLRHVVDFPAVGNHLYMASGLFGFGIFGNIDTYKDLASAPGNEEWYSVRYGNTEFFFLNSNWYYEPWRLSTKQISWLKGALAKANDGVDDPVFKVAIHHMPMWSSGPLHREFLDRIWTRNFFLKNYHAYGVDLALTSHDAHAEHSVDGSFHELQTACGKLRTEWRTKNPRSVWRYHGGRTIGLGSVTGKRMDLQVVDDAGNALHTFSIQK